MRRTRLIHYLRQSRFSALDGGDADVVAPTITSADTASVQENALLAHTLTADEPVGWSITGGADAARFELGGAGNILRWLSNGTKDFEAPNDADTNNAYVVEVTAADAANNETPQTITVTVTNVFEGGGGGTGADFSDEANSFLVAVLDDF